MNNSKISQAVKLAILTAGATTLVAPAVAQEEIEEITVTGSRIVRSDLESVSPLSVVNNEEFVISGNLNVEQKLAELPLTLPSFGPSSNNPGDGTARVDLRGLGSFRTLVLVNGRRYIPATQSGIVDLNTIPGTLIKQVDVVTGGASAVYGSDALAGVVNFQMVDDFEGVQVTGLYDITTEGDAEKYNFDVTVGGNFADGRGNAVVYASYSRRTPLFQGDRDFSTFALTDSAPAGTAGQNGNTGVGGPLAAGGSSGVPGTRDFTGLAIDPDGVAGSGDEYTLGTFNSDGTGAPWVEPDSRFNYAPDNYLQLPQRRYLMSALAHFDITETVTAYTELTFANNRVPQELAPTPAFLGSVVVNPDSPFFAPSIQTALDGIRSDTNGDGIVDGNDNATLAFIGRRMVENGSRQALDTRNAYRLLVGARGDINDQWSWDASWMRSDLKNDNLLNNDVSDSRFRQAVLVNDAGNACQNPSGGCAPLNVFGPGNISQAAIDFVNVGAANVTDIETEIFMATVSGEFGGIGDAGPIGLAIGFERRDDVSSFRPDEFLSGGDVLGFNAGEPTVGAYNATEFFGEINVPLLEGVPGAESLALWGAVRASDYSNIGNVTSYATALNWAPLEQVRFRGGYQRAVRAPNVSELFQGNANGFPGAVDQCSVDGSAAGTSAGNAVYDLCVATGVAPANVGVFTQANGQIEGIFGGNPDLTEETGDTYTLGVVLQPLDGLDITIDYFDITIEDSIDTLGGGVNGIIDICYNVKQDLGSEECMGITRRPDGNIDTVAALNANIGELKTSGFDLSVNYVTDFDAGFFGEGSTLAVSLRSTFLDNFEETPVVGLPGVNQCEGTWGDVCGEPRPEQQYNTRVTWLNGPLTVSMLWRHLSETDNDLIANRGADRSTLSVPVVDSMNYVDLSFAYQFTDSFRMNLGFKNIFDELPTFIGDGQEQANTFPETYSLFGPRVFLSGSYHWE